MDWKAIKKAAEPWEAYADDFFRPITEAEARAFMAMRNGTPQAQAFNPAMQKLYDPVKGQWTIGGVPVYLKENNSGPDEWHYENGQPVVRNFSVDDSGNEITDWEEWNRLRNEAPTMEDAERFHDNSVREYMSPDGSVVFRDSLTYDPYQAYHRREDSSPYGYPNFSEKLTDTALEKSGMKRESITMSPEDYADFINKVDPHGYLRKYGLEDYGTDEYYGEKGTRRADVFSDFLWKRANTDYLRYMKNERPEEYQNIIEELGYSPVEEMEEYKSPRERALEKLQKQQSRAAKRWGGSMVDLTPEQYAYYNAKKQMQANPKSQPHWDAYLKAKQPMTPNDLGQVNKYTVQQRMMNTPQPNGLKKTPAMLQQEWQQENRRRQNLQKDFYNTDRQAGKGYRPTPINTWNY